MLTRNNILAEAERLMALDDERVKRHEELSERFMGNSGSWHLLRDHMPEMMACIRGLYAHIAEHYGVEIE